MSNTNSNGTEYRVPVSPDLIRSLNDPHHENIRIIHSYVKVRDFPHGKVSDAINPRKHEQLEGQIPKKIGISLEENSEWFHLLNRGLLILSSNAWYDNKTKTLHFEICPDDCGLSDGATTDRVIRNAKEAISKADFDTLLESEIPEYLKEAYVHLEILAGLPDDMVVSLTSARNSSVIVKEFALEDLRGGFDDLKKSLENSHFKGRIRYRENDIQDVDVRTVLAILCMFHPRWDRTAKEPTIAYTSKAAVLNTFQNEEWTEGYDQLVPIAAEILDLHNYIHLHFRDQYVKAFPPNGRLGNRKEVKHYPDDRVFLSHPLLQEKTAYGITDGWIYPLLASFRALLDFPKKSNGRVTWKRDPQKFFDEFGHNIVLDLVEFSEEYGRNPNATGKSRLVWKTLRSNMQALINKN
jgi:hypothetical protein